MTRSELIGLITQQAIRNGFDFKHWFHRALALPWTTEATAIETLATERRYFALLFSHEFAQAFWKQGSQFAFIVPASSYTRRDKAGNLVRVERQPYIRRKVKQDAWKYHLREMACCEEPLKYMRRFILPVDSKQPAHKHDGRRHSRAAPARSSVARSDPAARRPGQSPEHFA